MGKPSEQEHEDHFLGKEEGVAKVEEKNWYLWIRENMSGEVMERKVGSNVKPFFVR